MHRILLALFVSYSLVNPLMAQSVECFPASRFQIVVIDAREETILLDTVSGKTWRLRPVDRNNRENKVRELNTKIHSQQENLIKKLNELGVETDKFKNAREIAEFFAYLSMYNEERENSRTRAQLRDWQLETTAEKAGIHIYQVIELVEPSSEEITRISSELRASYAERSRVLEEASFCWETWAESPAEPTTRADVEKVHLVSLRSTSCPSWDR